MFSSRLEIASILAIAATVIFLTSTSDVRAETLRIGGTGSATELMKRLGDAFEAKEPETTVEVIPSLGSSGGIEATRDGALDLAVSARPLKPSETGLIGIIAARTPYGLASSNPSPGNVASSDIAAFYASTSATWPDGTQVRVILRPKSESDTALLGNSYPGMAEAIDQVRARIDVPVAATDQDNLKMAESIDGSLVGTSLAQMVTEQRTLQFLSIDGNKPTLENLASGQYPYSKPFVFVFAAKPTPLVQRFVDFVNSGDGEALLRTAGCLPAAS